MDMVNWKIFDVKYDKREQWAFENMSYFLFCTEMDCRIGLFRYKNQAGIETEPIEKNGEFYGFQAKYYSTPISQNKADIIDSIQKAKAKNAQLNNILLYINKELSESGKKSKKQADYQVEIEQTAKKEGIKIEWRVPSYLEFQLSQPQNKWIFDIFFGTNGLDPDFFVNQIEKEIKNLGPRFNEKLNFELPIAQVFNSISNNSTYHQNIIAKTDKWLTEKRYRKLKDNELLAEIEIELETLRQEIKHWLIVFRSCLVENEITLLPLIEKVKTFNKKVSDKWHEIFDLSINRDEKDKSKKTFDSELSRLREVQDANCELIENIDDLYINLANYPTLIIQGEAGCGKSHLLGDIATQRKKQFLPTILLIGTPFTHTTTIERNILEKLDLTYPFKDFLENLNSIGLRINSRALILIDAINEGAGADLWKNQIAGFVNEVAKYPAVGLVLTIRSIYFDDIIPVDFKSNPNITIITHEGFKGNEYKALKLFCEYHDLKLPNFPILNPEYANPLFLHLVCDVVKKLPDKSFPKGFNGMSKTYNSYKENLDNEFGKKRHEYKNRNIVSKSIKKLANAIFNTEYRQLEIQDAVNLFDKEFIQFPHLLSDLIEESVLIKMRNEYDRENSKDIVFFSYQRLGDFFMAEELLKPYHTKEEIKNAFVNDPKFQKIANEYQWQYRGVVEAFSILLPERYNFELFELIDFFFDKNVDKKNKKWQMSNTYESFTRILLDSLQWRELNSINEKKITQWLEKYGKYIGDEEWLYTLSELAAIPNHPFNSDRLHKILMRHSMPERDGFWQKYIRGYSGYDDNKIAFPLKRLTDWAWLPNISNNVDFETTRLVAQILSWVLSSTNVALRDKTTKALVNLLEQQPQVLIKTLIAFENIDDMYISERLYAVTYGCILRTEKEESIKVIAQYIYDTIFKTGNPPVHILIRDYARNAVEYGIYKNVGLDINVELIRPPYNSQCDYTPLPNEELDEKYEPKEDKGHWGKEEWGKGAILRSMTTEYGRGMCMYGDFGRYIFQSKLSNFVLPDKLNVDLLSNLAVEWIFEKYGYNVKLHGEYDNSVQHYYSGRSRPNIERIGKKYQWIALYEILARIADNYKMGNRWSFDNKYSLYKGAWQLYVRNIDPAYITKNQDEDEEKSIEQDIKSWWDDTEYTHWNCPDSEWVKTIDDLINPKQVIEKKDANGERWLHLQHFVEWNEPKKIGIERYEGRIKRIWYIIQGLLVKKSDKQKIINFLNNQSLWSEWVPENRDDHSELINREKFWSPAYLDIYKNNRKLWETIRDTKYKVIVATESANGGIENDKSGANRSYNIPCKYIFEGMKLQYAPIDGNLRNVNGEVIVMNSNPKGVLIRKKDLIQFLEDNDLDIIWTLLGEKFSFIDSRSEESYFKVPCGVYSLENGHIKGKLKMHDRS